LFNLLEIIFPIIRTNALYPTQTPREAIRFSAKLRGLPNADERTEEVIQQLGLENCANGAIGSDMIKGISGGEKKRTSIGFEIVSQPDIIFLDEPTSGLDSYSAEVAIEAVRKLCQKRQGRSALATIHQPSSQLFFQFDDVIFLARGRVVYQGPVNAVSDHFKVLGYPCDFGHNLADHVIHLIQILPEKVISEWCDRFLREGVLGARGFSFIAAATASCTPEDTDFAMAQSLQLIEEENHHRMNALNIHQTEPSSVGVSRASLPAFEQVLPLFLREARNLYRDFGVVKARLKAIAFISIIVGIIFFQSGDHNRSDYSPTAHLGALVMLASTVMMNHANGVLLIFALHRSVFVREHAAGLYGPVLRIVFTNSGCLRSILDAFYLFFVVFG